MDDLFVALKNGRDDATVRGFTSELVDGKQLPISYLVRKVKEGVGAAKAKRPDVLLGGSYAVKQEQAQHATAGTGVLKRLFSGFSRGRRQAFTDTHRYHYKIKFGFVFSCALWLVVGFGPAIAAESTADAIFSEVERTIIERYFGRRTGSGAQSETHSEKPAKRGKNRGNGKGNGEGKGKAKKLPPGLARRTQLPPGLAKRETLPPGLQREPFPRDLASSLPAPLAGTERILIEGRAVLIDKATNRVLDVLEDVLATRR